MTAQGEIVRVVIARDAGSACRAASAAGDVVTLVRLDEALL
jgi:hypothetical protein